jgi:hypothetical protein
LGVERAVFGYELEAWSRFAPFGELEDEIQKALKVPLQRFAFVICLLRTGGLKRKGKRVLRPVLPRDRKGGRYGVSRTRKNRAEGQ